MHASYLMHPPRESFIPFSMVFDSYSIIEGCWSNSGKWFRNFFMSLFSKWVPYIFHTRTLRVGKTAIPHRSSAFMKMSEKNRVLLLIRNIWHVLHIIACRYTGCPPRYLPVILMFLTSRCNLRCKMCGVCDLHHEERNDAELSTEEWKSIIRSAASRLGTTLAVISGGEALLREDVFELIRYATESGMSIHLCTNALLLTEEKMIQLRDSGVSTVSFSLDGPDAATHEYLRGKDTFPISLNALKRFHEIAPKVLTGINYVITRKNYKKMPAMLHFAEELGVNQIKFAPIHTNLLHRHKNIDDYSDLIFMPADLDDLEIEINKLRSLCRKSRLITTSDAFFKGIKDLYVSPQRIRCPAGYAICAINPAGYVAPCSDMDSTFNTRERDLSEIWRDPKFHQLRRQVHECRSACWDTAYTELSLWLRPTSLLRGILRNWRDVKFYFNRHNP